MGQQIPESLSALLKATDDVARERAWDSLVLEFNGLLMHVARRQGGGHDATMERYVHIVRGLRENDFRRLRKYQATSGARFTTWLLVVCSRLCLDEYRSRYGRLQSGSDAAAENNLQRRRLVDLVSDEVALDTLEAAGTSEPDALLQQAELSDRLQAALEALSTSDRLLLRFRFEDDLSVPKIARLLGEESPFAVYRRLDRILRILRTSLTKAGINESLP